MTAPVELYACLYATEFPAQALLRLRPGAREQACVVMDGDPPLQMVCALNRKARELGVEHAMTKVEVDIFPAVTVFTRSCAEEDATKTALLECAGNFSPRVELLSAGSAFQCVIDIAGTNLLFGPALALAHNLLAGVRALGIEAVIAVSSNFHAAIALAKGLSRRDPVQVVATGEETAALASLPLAVLDLDVEQAETLMLWGIRTLGMLATLPEKDLVARIGQAGKLLRERARGELPHLFQPVEHQFTLAERIELDSPVELLDSLLFVVGAMLEQLIVRAKARIVALAAVTVTLELGGGRTHARTVRPALPANDKQLWIKLLHLDLEAHPPPAAVLAVALDAEPGLTSKVQLGLFSPQLPEASRLDVTLARIRAIVGEENVGRAVLVDTHASDGFRMENFAVPVGNAETAAPVHLRSAVRQLRPAEEITVMLEARRPVRFSFRGQRYIVERAYGPWLAGGDWWQQTLWGNEQWDLVARIEARTETGDVLCCCAMRDLMLGGWQVAALYD
ncbi:MAG: DNA polymerase Y family protein [Terracidiphilus sp.]